MKYGDPYKNFRPDEELPLVLLQLLAIGYFRSFAVPAIDIGYFCSHVGVGVSDTLADRSGQQ